MFQALKKYNFGERFLQWVKILHNQPVACIKNNGWLSETFELGWGVRQGCPLAVVWFIHCVEITAGKIRKMIL